MRIDVAGAAGGSVVAAAGLAFDNPAAMIGAPKMMQMPITTSMPRRTGRCPAITARPKTATAIVAKTEAAWPVSK